MSPLPVAQTSALDLLSQENLLSGVPPTVLGAIDVAESSGEGGGLNPQGYGGFFGLGAGKSYPGGYTIGASELQDPSPASFAAQAEAAGAEFSSLLASHGGNPYAAETAYQGGGTEGTSIFASMGIPTYIAPGAITPAATAASANPGLASQLGATPAPVSSGTATATPTGFGLNPFNWPSDLVKGIGKAMALATFVAGGLALVVLGVDRTTGGRLRDAAQSGAAGAGSTAGAGGAGSTAELAAVAA